MGVWTCNDFTGHWPVGTAAVVVAKNRDEAERLLAAELTARGLGGAFNLEPLPSGPYVRILADGDY